MECRADECTVQTRLNWSVVSTKKEARDGAPPGGVLNTTEQYCRCAALRRITLTTVLLVSTGFVIINNISHCSAIASCSNSANSFAVSKCNRFTVKISKIHVVNMTQNKNMLQQPCKIVSTVPAMHVTRNCQSSHDCQSHWFLPETQTALADVKATVSNQFT